jgi:hypothetical protein
MFAERAKKHSEILMVATRAYFRADGSRQNLIEWLHASADRSELVRSRHFGPVLDVIAPKLFCLKIDPISRV